MSYRRPRSLQFGSLSTALLSGRKTVIRVPWSARRAVAFRPGEIVPAYDRRPREGGHQIALLRVLERPYHENSAHIPEPDYEAEGFVFMEETGATICNRAPRELWDELRREPRDLCVIRFQVVDIVPGAWSGLEQREPREPAGVR